MRHMTSPLREAASRRHVSDAAVGPADHTTTSFTPQAAHGSRHAACWAETLLTRLSLAAMQSRQPAPPGPRMAPPARTSPDFTAQVMARLTSAPLEPDPRERKARKTRAHMRRFARIYLTLVLVSGVALGVWAALAPSVLLGMLTGIVSAALLALTFTSFVSSATDGVISGFGVAWVAMLAALAPPLWLLARRATRGRSSSTRRW